MNSLGTGRNRRVAKVDAAADTQKAFEMMQALYKEAHKLGFAMAFLPKKYDSGDVSNNDLQIVAEEICASAHYLDMYDSDGHAIVAMSKVFCGDLMFDTVFKCMQIAAVNAVDKNHPLEKLPARGDHLPALRGGQHGNVESQDLGRDGRPQLRCQDAD